MLYRNCECFQLFSLLTLLMLIFRVNRKTHRIAWKRFMSEFKKVKRHKEVRKYLNPISIHGNIVIAAHIQCLVSKPGNRIEKVGRFSS